MPKVLVAYDTRTGNTGRMAKAVAEGAASVEGAEVILKRVGSAGSDLADADAIIIGSPTHSKHPSRAMKKFLSNCSKVLLKGKVGAAFGSYGWSGEAPGIMMRALRDRGVRLMGVYGNKLHRGKEVTQRRKEVPYGARSRFMCTTAAGPLVPEPAPIEGVSPSEEEVKMAMVRVGKEAPDFEAQAFVADEGFKDIRLSDHRGRWVVLMFYPADFTFV